MRPIATETNDFETLRAKGQIYVDKTAHLHRMITDPSRSYFFCARPRRFGKSLSVTTMKSIFLGHREFFEDLAIAKTDYDWKVHPVIHLNWGKVSVASIAEFTESITTAVKNALTETGYAYDPKLIPSDNLGNAIDFFAEKSEKEAAEKADDNSPCNKGRGVVVLIDEYDDPVAKALANVELAEQIRTHLADIYAQFKDRTDKIRFLYITGVSKFTKLSIFSTLSNLNDISFEDDYAELYGYTEDELTANYDEYLHRKAERMKLSYDEFRAELKRWFNGYRFAKENPVTVYNPVSISLSLFSSASFLEATWTSTGRASMLVNFIKREGALSIDPDRTIDAVDADFDVADLDHIQMIGMLYQTGYLTIESYSNQLYTLRVPDEEVRQDLAALVAGAYAGKDAQWSASLGGKLRAGRWDDFFDGLRCLYAKLPYGAREKRERKNEAAYARPLCMLLAAQGFRYDPEVVQTLGRSDLIARSEERRVGKECRSRWSPYH